eukprot:tig00000317_g24020.t1
MATISSNRARLAMKQAPTGGLELESAQLHIKDADDAQEELEAVLDEARPAPHIYSSIVGGTVESAARVPAVEFKPYSAFHLALFRALRTKWTRAEAVSLAEADWLSDSVRGVDGQSVVTRRHVQSSLVNLALWWGASSGSECGAGDREAPGSAMDREPGGRAAWCRDFLAALLECIAREDAASGALSVAPFDEVPVGCCVRAALRIRLRSRSPSTSPSPSPSDVDSSSSGPSSPPRCAVDPAWLAAAARAILSSLERPDVKVGEDRRRLWDRTHLRRHALANRLRGRLESGHADAYVYVADFDFQI